MKANNQWFRSDSCVSFISRRTPVEIHWAECSWFPKHLRYDCLPYSTVPKSICWRGPRLPGYTVSSLMMTSDLTFSEDNTVRLLIGMRGDVKQIARLNPPREQALNMRSSRTGTRWFSCRNLQVRHQMPRTLWQRSPKPSANNPKVEKNYFLMFRFSICSNVYNT